jgi:alkanesulfonate monooxygenase SsuD/methylene tetrahydromethanopterin reductase-like flavin-dependent oxidoreductase (luciferase family)
MELGVHLPLMEFGDEGQSLERLNDAVDAARMCGFGAVSANDHFVFSTPWLDGPTALAAVLERSGEMTLSTSIALAPLRGPVPLAKTLTALDVLSGGRLVAGVGPGSSARDYEAVGVPFEERWPRFDEAVAILRSLLRGERPPPAPRFYPLPDAELEPRSRQDPGPPVWIGSWGSDAGLRRIARLADGWLASAYNTTPENFSTARRRLATELAEQGKHPDRFPNALMTMWTWITDDRAEADRVLADTLGPFLKRDPEELRGQVCVGPPGRCAELLARYAAAGCERVHVWPLGDEPRQIERIAAEVAPQIR